MRLPRMTARRWFWGLTVVLAIYLTAALRMDAGKTRPDPLGGRSLQALQMAWQESSTPVLLLPAAWGVGKVQDLFTSHSNPGQTLSPEAIDKLQQEHTEMLNELEQMQAELKLRNNQLRELHVMPW